MNERIDILDGNEKKEKVRGFVKSNCKWLHGYNLWDSLVQKYEGVELIYYNRGMIVEIKNDLNEDIKSKLIRLARENNGN